MKHSFKVILVLLLLFILIQYVGIAVLQKYVNEPLSEEQGEVVFEELPFGERPPLDEETSYVTMLLAVLLGTGLAFLLMRFRLALLWKVWFFVALLMTILTSLGAFLPFWLAFSLSFVSTLWRILKPNIFVHTLTELLVYPGLAVIFVPLFSLSSISILLVLIAFYDAYAVWKSKHMITLAKSQAKAKIFAGLLVPYAVNTGRMLTTPRKSIGGKRVSAFRTAVLGGGDVAFPLLFTGVIFKEFGLWQSLLIPLFAATTLGILFWNAEDQKFYPAMPFLAVGCFVGLGVVMLLSYLF
ncbi:hypothetical protein HY496_02315 [Candidatus Woesearchaeota archaeon]|nr:hypothetical protein [Candidatus Woesearchaeota archaeon]